MIISAALLLLSYVSTYVNPAKAWFMTIFGLLFAPLLLCNFLLFVWAILRKSKALVIPFLALLPTVFMAGKFFRFTDGGNVDAEGGVKILTYNVGRFALAKQQVLFVEKMCGLGHGFHEIQERGYNLHPGILHGQPRKGTLLSQLENARIRYQVFRKYK